MKRRDFLIAATAVPFLTQAQSQGQSPEQSPEQGEDGFVSLFDGKSLNGWTVADGPETAFYVEDGSIVVQESEGFPSWLRSVKQYENFDFRGEFFIKGWSDSGIYFHVPEHGRPTWNGIQIHLFHEAEARPKPQSMGAIFPILAPGKVNVKDGWNSFRILMDWPRLQVWTNGEMVQDVDVVKVPELKYRFRRGFLGFESLSYPLKFRSLRVRELAATDRHPLIYGSPGDFAANWMVTEGKPAVQLLGGVIHLDGNGQIGTRVKYRDFDLQMFVRHAKHHNSGVLFRADGFGETKRRYEIQLHDVEGAHYPTGSLYSIKRALYPKIEAEVWFPMRVVVKERNVLVRINGDTVLEYDQLDNLEEASIQLQAHAPGKWTEFKQVRLRRL